MSRLGRPEFFGGQEKKNPRSGWLLVGGERRAYTHDVHGGLRVVFIARSFKQKKHSERIQSCVCVCVTSLPCRECWFVTRYSEPNDCSRIVVSSDAHEESARSSFLPSTHLLVLSSVCSLSRVNAYKSKFRGAYTCDNYQHPIAGGEPHRWFEPHT